MVGKPERIALANRFQIRGNALSTRTPGNRFADKMAERSTGKLLKRELAGTFATPRLKFNLAALGRLTCRLV
jgi:hypothetical protein